MTSTWKRPITRRQMLAGSGIAVGAGVTAALIGCGDDDDAPPAATEAPAEATEAPAEATEAPAEATEAPAEATEATAEATAAPAEATPEPTEAPETGPKQGGTLRYAVQGDLLLTNGAPFTRAQGIPILVFESLIRYEDSPSPTLVLLDSYEVSEDLTTVTMRLKDNAVFHDGSPVTPDDVFFGIDAIVNPDQYGFSFRGQLLAFASLVTDMSTIDDRTMVFTFGTPLANINDFFAQFPVTKRDTYAGLQSGENIQGTGPYRMKSWTPGVGYELEPSDNWHDDRGGPYLDGVQVIQFADAEAVGQAYAADDIDIATGVSPVFGKAHEEDVRLAAKWGIVYVGLNVTNPYFADKRVRQALFFAIDRERIVNELMEGLVELTTQPWDPGSPAFDPSLEQPFYDPERSRALLAEAGFSQTEPITFDHYANHPVVGAQLASLIKNNFADVGVEIELVGHQIPDMNQKLFERNFEAGWFLMTGFSPFSPVTVITQPLPFQDNNPSQYTSETFLDIRAKLKTLDPFSEEALVQYDRFNELFHDDPWLLPCAPFRGINVVKPRVQGYNSFIEPLTYLGYVWIDDEA